MRSMSLSLSPSCHVPTVPSVLSAHDALGREPRSSNLIGAFFLSICFAKLRKAPALIFAHLRSSDSLADFQGLRTVIGPAPTEGRGS